MSQPVSRCLEHVVDVRKHDSLSPVSSSPPPSGKDGTRWRKKNSLISQSSILASKMWTCDYSLKYLEANGRKLLEPGDWRFAWDLVIVGKYFLSDQKIPLLQSCLLATDFLGTW